MTRSLAMQIHACEALTASLKSLGRPLALTPIAAERSR
jgi:hypothetical protein